MDLRVELRAEKRQFGCNNMKIASGHKNKIKFI